MNMFRRVPAVVLFDEEGELALVVRCGYGRVRADNRPAFVVFQRLRVRGFYEEARRDRQERRFVVRELKHKPAAKALVRGRIA